MKSFHYAGCTHEYSANDTFWVETGRLQNAYKLQRMFSAVNAPFTAHVHAIEEYERLEVSDGYKKRLSLFTNGKRKTITKQLSIKQITGTCRATVEGVHEVAHE